MAACSPHPPQRQHLIGILAPANGRHARLTPRYERAFIAVIGLYALPDRSHRQALDGDDKPGRHGITLMSVVPSIEWARCR